LRRRHTPSSVSVLHHLAHTSSSSCLISSPVAAFSTRTVRPSSLESRSLAVAGVGFDGRQPCSTHALLPKRSSAPFAGSGRGASKWQPASSRWLLPERPVLSLVVVHSSVVFVSSVWRVSTTRYRGPTVRLKCQRTRFPSEPFLFVPVFVACVRTHSARCSDAGPACLLAFLQ